MILFILLKIVFVSMIVDLLLYGRGQLKHVNSNNNYSFNASDITTSFSLYEIFSFITFAFLIIFFINHISIGNDPLKLQHYTFFLLFSLFTIIPTICVEIYYSNNLHRIKDHGNMLYNVTEATPPPNTAINSNNQNLNALSYSTSQLSTNYANYFGWANRW